MIRLPSPRPLGELIERLGGEPDDGLAPRMIAAVAPPWAEHDEAALLPVLRPRHIAAAHASRGVLLVEASLAGRVERGRRWVHRWPSWALAMLLGPDELPPDERHLALVEPGASVAPGARVGARAIVRAGAVVADGVVIEPGAQILGGVVLRAGARVGAGSILGRAGFGWAQGPDGRPLRVPHRGGVLVEEDAELGAFCTVDAGVLTPTVIGRGVKLDSHVHVGHNVVLGPGTLVAAQSGFAGSVEVGRGVRVGGQVGVADHAVVGDGAQLAARAGVIGDVAPGVTVAGYPAIERVRWLRAVARLLGPERRHKKTT